jgi:B12-binding domain/radical SAM domain protein
MNYDAILIHPPAIYDFRQRVIFPGPIAYTVSESGDQFMIPPVGMLSIAEYLDRNGYRVIVDNLGERMVTVEGFDVEEHIKSLSARVIGIGLHWCVHSQGTIELARLCKRLHPEAMVVVGGLTSTVFSEEIIQKYEFIDAVIRGEAEKPFLELMKVLEQNDKLDKVPNLTFRNREGKVSVNEMMEPSETLDEYEYTRLDLIEPKKIIYPEDRSARWFIPICRGCSYNCATCGGSRYSYKTYLKREKPAFRSPEKIAGDIDKLSKQGIQRIFLFQDPRMGGKEYWTKLFSTLRSNKIESMQISMELFGPADEEYIRQMANTGVPIVLSISPESCCNSVRKAQGRKYDNEELFNTLRLCKKYNIPIGVFSMIALGDDTPKTVKETWKVWEQICMMNDNGKGKSPIHHAFGPMILLDPGSPAFDYPANYGYRLRFSNLQEYIEGMSLLSWHQWISYETKYLNRESIAKLIIDSIEYSINLREKFGLFNGHEASSRKLRSVTINKMVMDIVDQAMDIEDEEERLEALRSFKKELDEALSKMVPVSDDM